RPDMDVDDRVGVRARLPHRLPEVAVERWKTEGVGVLAERERTYASRGVAADLLGRALRVGKEPELAGDETLGRRAAPGFDVPVVEGLDAREAGVAVGDLRERRTCEPPRGRREVQRRPYAVEIHVADARVDVVDPGPVLVDAPGRLVLVGDALVARRGVHGH